MSCHEIPLKFATAFILLSKYKTTCLCIICKTTRFYSDSFPDHKIMVSYSDFVLIIRPWSSIQILFLEIIRPWFSIQILLLIITTLSPIRPFFPSYDHGLMKAMVIMPWLFWETTAIQILHVYVHTCTYIYLYYLTRYSPPLSILILAGLLRKQGVLKETYRKSNILTQNLSQLQCWGCITQTSFSLRTPAQAVQRQVLLRYVLSCIYTTLLNRIGNVLSSITLLYLHSR